MKRTIKQTCAAIVAAINGKGRKYCSKACRYAKNKKSTTNFC